MAIHRYLASIEEISFELASGDARSSQDIDGRSGYK